MVKADSSDHPAVVNFQERMAEIATSTAIDEEIETARRQCSTLRDARKELAGMVDELEAAEAVDDEDSVDSDDEELAAAPA